MPQTPVLEQIPNVLQTTMVDLLVHVCLDTLLSVVLVQHLLAKVLLLLVWNPPLVLTTSCGLQTSATRHFFFFCKSKKSQKFSLILVFKLTYYTDGLFVFFSDINECATANICGASRLCINLLGSFQCQNGKHYHFFVLDIL